MAMRGVVVVVLTFGCGPVVGASDGSSNGEASSSGSTDATTDVTATSTTLGEASTSHGTADSSESTDAGVDTSTTDVARPCDSPTPSLTLLACGAVSSALAADDAAVYAVVDGDLLRIDPNGATIDLLVASSGARTLVRQDASLHWADFDEGEVGTVDLATGTATTLARGLTKPAGIAADDTWIYASQYVAEGTVLRIPIVGGPAEVLYEGLDHPGAILRIDDDLYVVDSANDANNSTPIRHGSTSGAPLSDLAEIQGVTGELVPHGDHLYWAAYSVRSSALRSIALSPAAMPETLFATEYQPRSMAIRGDRIWWSEGGDMGDYSALRWWSMPDGDDAVVVSDRDLAFGAMVATQAGVVVSTALGVAIVHDS
jgi:hypothetical protein